MKLPPRQIEAAVYLVGIIVLALVQGNVRERLGDGWSFIAVVAYLAALRGVGFLMTRAARTSRGRK
jgi:hypothetical protein